MLPQPKHVSTTATPLTNDPLWLDVLAIDGEGLSSEQPIKNFIADAAGYVDLVELEYKAISGCDKCYVRSVPASAHAYYHHILWWYQVALNAQKHGLSSRDQEELIDFVDRYDIQLAAGAATYLNGMGDYTDITGVKHYMIADEPLENGTFGSIDANNQQKYGMHPSPFVSYCRVRSDLENTKQRDFDADWIPSDLCPELVREAGESVLIQPYRQVRRQDIEEVQAEDPNLRSQKPIVPLGGSHNAQAEAVPQLQKAGVVEGFYKPTANLLGWRRAVKLNKNQLHEMAPIFNNAEQNFVINRFALNHGLFNFVCKRIKGCKRYQVVDLPKSTTGSIAQSLIWEPNSAVMNENQQFISGEGKVRSRAMVPARFVTAARVLCYRAIRARFEEPFYDNLDVEVHPWAPLHHDNYRRVPDTWKPKRNERIVLNLRGLFDYTPFASAITNRHDAVVEFLNQFKKSGSHYT